MLQRTLSFLCPFLIEGKDHSGANKTVLALIKAINSLCQNCIFKEAVKFLFGAEACF